jgi:DNA-binding response OmpR family regulator
MNSTTCCGKSPIVRAEIHPVVLVIDDEPLVRWALVTGLRHAGIEAVGVAGPEEARWLRMSSSAIVLLDGHLHGRDASRVLEEVRAIAPASRVLLLVVEGRDLPIAGWREADVIRKPFDLNRVIRRVAELIGRQSVRMAV